VVQLNPTHTKLLADYGVQNTLEGKSLYRQRQAVERAFSRLKGQRSLSHITVRRLRKVTAHCYLSLIAMQASKAATQTLGVR
jgi:transposase